MNAGWHVLLCLGLLLGPSVRTAAPQAADADLQVQMSEARRHFDALEYEQTVPVLDRAIAVLETRDGDDARRMLAEALEIRARARFGLSDLDGAREDFAALLRIDPGHALTGEISPRVVAIFDEARKATVTALLLTVEPAGAVVLLDGARVNAGEIPVLIGTHTLAASRAGYRSDSRTFTAAAEEIAEQTITLERTAAVLSFVTAPADVEVLVDGVSRGRTASGPLPPDVTARVTAAGIGPADAPGMLTLTDLGTGTHRIEFRRACFVQAERRQDITELDDFLVDPVKLEPAMATIVASSSQPETNVFVDGESRGQAPYTTQLCEGAHAVELRSATGRYRQSVQAKAGQRVEVTGTLRPAFAIVASTQTSLNADLRGAIERAFAPLRSILVFAPPAEALDSALKAEKLPPDWLGYDANRRPFGVSAEVTTAMRRELSTRLSRAFDAQGIAAVTAPVPTNRSRLVLSLLGTGIADPDVVEVNLEQPDTVADAVARIDRTLSFFTPTIGVSAVDVVDMPGPVVVAIDDNGPAAQSGLAVGDVILTADGKPVADGAALTAAVASHGGGESVALSAKNAAGSEKKLEVKVLMRPRVLGISDQTVLVNRTLVVLRARLADAKDPLEQAAIRLNLAAALVHLESWNEARTELQQVTLPDGPGVGTGTVQYLIGLCSARLGNRADAETALKAAVASNSLLTEDGPPVRDLAQARLAELSRDSLR